MLDMLRNSTEKESMTEYKGILHTDIKVELKPHEQRLMPQTQELILKRRKRAAKELKRYQKECQLKLKIVFTLGAVIFVLDKFHLNRLEGELLYFFKGFEILGLILFGGKLLPFGWEDVILFIKDKFFM
jgi:hypothetical protein